MIAWRFEFSISKHCDVDALCDKLDEIVLENVLALFLTRVG
jgi:hypothetical protein